MPCDACMQAANTALCGSECNAMPKLCGRVEDLHQAPYVCACAALAQRMAALA